MQRLKVLLLTGGGHKFFFPIRKCYLLTAIRKVPLDLLYINTGRFFQGWFQSLLIWHLGRLALLLMYFFKRLLQILIMLQFFKRLLTMLLRRFKGWLQAFLHCFNGWLTLPPWRRGTFVFEGWFFFIWRDVWICCSQHFVNQVSRWHDCYLLHMMCWILTVIHIAVVVLGSTVVHGSFFAQIIKRLIDIRLRGVGLACLPVVCTSVKIVHRTLFPTFMDCCNTIIIVIRKALTLMFFWKDHRIHNFEHSFWRLIPLHLRILIVDGVWVFHVVIVIITI